MSDFREPFVEGKDNLEQIIKALEENVPVSIEIVIKSFYEEDEQVFVIEFRPTLPLALEAETKEEAVNKAQDALRFLIKNECQDRNLNLDWKLLEFKITMDN
jgi:predicted RNase H-like HicB family nuclease